MIVLAVIWPVRAGMVCGAYDNSLDVQIVLKNCFRHFGANDSHKAIRASRDRSPVGMNQRSTNGTKPFRRGKLYAIIVAAILACATVIGSLLVMNALSRTQRQTQRDRPFVKHEGVQWREDQILHLAEQIPGGFDLYFNYYMGLTQDTTEEEKEAKLDEIEARLKQMQQAQLEREAARPNQMQSPSP